jgi:carbon storage regulator
MLVLTRKADQQILIGPNIKITIIEVKGRYVRLGIDAPQDVRIVRSEIAAPPPSLPAPTGEEPTAHAS